jgi:hypothetical protein
MLLEDFLIRPRKLRRGNYTMLCTVANREQLGMARRLVVR